MPAPRAGRIRYVLIPVDAKETNQLITDVETTFEEVTVDSLSFKSKNGLELGGRRSVSAAGAGPGNFPRVALPQSLRIPAELPRPRAAAPIGSP